MAKSTKAVEEKVSFRERVKELEKRFSQPEPNRLFIPTGSMHFDWGLGGGYQTGRIYELIAWEGGGKTTLSLHAVAECQKLGHKAVYIDSEHALDKEYAKAIGVDWDNDDTFAMFQPDNGEDGFEYARAMMETGEVRLLIIDSANGMLPQKQMEGEAGTSNLGLHARLMGQEVPKLKAAAAKYNVAVIFISQFREKIGVMFGSPETTQGGHALKFWASGRIELRRQLDKEGDEVVGIKAKYKVIKNKVVSPYRKGEIPIEFGIGIDKLAEAIELGKECGLLKARAQAGIKYITFGEDKYAEHDFRGLLNDNPEFYNKLKSQIINCLEGGVGQVDPTEETKTTEG